MFETKRSRGWFLIVVAMAVVVVQGGFGLLSNRALDDRVRSFEDQAHAAFDDTTTDQMTTLSVDSFSGPNATAAMYELLSSAGVDPETFGPSDDGFRARHRVEAWGQERRVDIRWTDDGVAIAPSP